MKNKLMSIGTIVAGVLLAAGPQFLFKVCPVGDKPMKCFYTAKALIAVGVILAVVGALQLLAKQAESKRLLAITGAVVCGMFFYGFICLLAKDIRKRKEENCAKYIFKR